MTTTVFGNCGVGFAPVRPGKSPYLINLMEGVEDIPGTVLNEGVKFDWESFPDYLDTLESMRRAVDVAAQLPHGALRFYVMGDRGADHAEVPNEREIEEMARLTEQALRAGAMGFTTSRTTKHKAKDGRFTPSLSAREAELLGIAAGMKRAGRGVLQVNSDFGPGEFEALEAASSLAGRPLSCLLVQVDAQPRLWRETLDQIHGVRQAGRAGQCAGGLAGRSASSWGWRPRPILSRPTRPGSRCARLLPPSATPGSQPTPSCAVAWSRRRAAAVRVPFWPSSFHKMFPVGDRPDYEPDARNSIAAIAERTGRTPQAVALDTLMTLGGKGLLMLPFENYAYGSLDVVHEMITDPATVLGVADGGAHVGVICDASSPTSLLTLWGRDRTRGPKLPLEFLVAKQTRGHGRGLWPSRPRPAGAWPQGRHQRDRLRRAVAQATRGGLRPAGRRPAPDPARVGLSAHLQCRCRDRAERRADGRAAGAAGARGAGTLVILSEAKDLIPLPLDPSLRSG